MALLHPQSCDCVDTGLDLFSVPPTQTSVESGVWVEYHPLATLSGGPIEFAISGSGEEYVDLSQVYLHVKAKITRGDGTDLQANEPVGPVNLWLHSLFSQVDVSWNDVLVSPSQNTYPYRALLETLLSYGNETKYSRLTASMFYKDTAGHMNVTNNNNNTGLHRRKTATQLSQTVDMVGKLHTDVTQQNRYLLNGVDVKVRLVRSKNSFSLMGHGGNLTFKSVVRHASLFVRKCKLNPAVMVAHAKALQSGTAKYPISRVSVSAFSIPQGNLAAVQSNLFLNQLPKRVIVGLVNSAAFNGNYNLNPFNFQHYDLNFLALYVGGVQVNAKPLTPDYQNQHYARSFFSVFSGTGIATADSGNGISYSDYPNGYCLYGFDLTSNLHDGQQLIRTGSLRLELKFSNALPNSVHVVVYSEQDSLIELTRNREVLLDVSS